MAVNEDLADATIAHRLDLLRYEAGVVRRVVAAYEGALADLVRDLEVAQRGYESGRISIGTVNRLSARVDGLRENLAGLLRLTAGVLDESLDAAARVEVAAQLSALRASTAGVDISFVSPSLADVLLAIDDPIGGNAWGRRLATDLLEVHDGVQDAVARAIARGSSMDRAARDIGEALGVVNANRSRLVAIARTEIQRVANTAALATYEANADVIQGVEYLATLDSRTCPTCAPLHGQVWPLGSEAIRRPPLHPRCRCFLSPQTKSWAELGLGPAQASLFDGAPSGGPDFDAWLQRQPEATADEVLGPARAAAWRDGLALDKFSDGRDVLTLEVLRERYPDAFV